MQSCSLDLWPTCHHPANCGVVSEFAMDDRHIGMQCSTPLARSQASHDVAGAPETVSDIMTQSSAAAHTMYFMLSS